MNSNTLPLLPIIVIAISFALVFALLLIKSYKKCKNGEVIIILHS